MRNIQTAEYAQYSMPFIDRDNRL